MKVSSVSSYGLCVNRNTNSQSFSGINTLGKNAISSVSKATQKNGCFSFGNFIGNALKYTFKSLGYISMGLGFSLSKIFGPLMEGLGKGMV